MIFNSEKFSNDFQAVSTFVKDWTKITGILNKDPYAFSRVFPAKLVKTFMAINSFPCKQERKVHHI